jgi:hypothetical protein
VQVARRELVTVEGDLRELTGAELRRQERREVVRARTRDELETLARQRGYRPGWVAHMLAARSKA